MPSSPDAVSGLRHDIGASVAGHVADLDLLAGGVLDHHGSTEGPAWSAPGDGDELEAGDQQAETERFQRVVWTFGDPARLCKALRSLLRWLLSRDRWRAVAKKTFPTSSPRLRTPTLSKMAVRCS